MLTGLAELRAQGTQLGARLDAIQASLQLGDAESFMSPTGKQYEVFVDGLIDDWLMQYCGLRIADESRRGIPASDVAAGNMQWDARFSVTLVRGWVSPPPAELPRFFVYGARGSGAYSPPGQLAALRKLSPTKPSADAEYFAILEYTRFPGWNEEWKGTSSGKARKALLPRLETRLHVAWERVKSAGQSCESASCESVLGAVALVGVVGEYACRESVETQLSNPACAWPLLREMYNAGRFVFFHCTAVVPIGSPLRLAVSDDSDST